jgi:hypothetical protein
MEGMEMNKMRRVVVTLELETDAPLKTLRDKKTWAEVVKEGEKLIQVQVNVIRAKGK